MKRVIVAAVIGLSLYLPASPALAACHRFTFSRDVYSVGEGAGTVTIRVSRDAGAAPSSIEYNTVAVTAEPGQDFAPTAGTLAFTTGQISKTFSVSIRNDTRGEQVETFRVRLHDPAGCQPNPNFDVDEPSTVRILDNDTASAPAPSPSPTSASTPAPAPSVTRSPSPSPSPTESPTPSPTDTAIATGEGEDGGLSGGALAGIVAGVIVVGGGAALLVRRRFLT